MNGREITQRLERHPTARRIFRGVYARDELPTRVNLHQRQAFIINTDKAGEPGQHWVAIYFPGHGKPAEYFDSFGLRPLYREIEDFIFKHYTRCLYNQSSLQDVESAVCGLYCMYFVIRKSRGVRLENVLSIFDPRQPWINDRRVTFFLQQELRTKLNRFY